jgi:DEAD/DEAH box helicase domain-containing protein
MRQMAALFLMCDRRDLGVAVEENSLPSDSTAPLPSLKTERRQVVPQIFEPNLFLYDNYPGGIGLSQPLYDLQDRVLAETARLIRSCPCEEGCPSCVGPRGETGDLGKEVALAILDQIL